MIKIISVGDEGIFFSNGSYISCGHLNQDCCENNYADFEQIEKEALNVSFTLPLTFEKVTSGFRFGNPPQKMFFIPCYSEQSGYYDETVNIFFTEHVLNTEGEWIR